MGMGLCRARGSLAIRLGRWKMHVNFGGPLNNLQVKNRCKTHDLAMYVVSIWTATMNKTESTQPAIFPKVLFIVLTRCLQPASPAQLLEPSASTQNISTD